MFKMNPHAKEFIPAHILRKRKEQEEADGLAKLTDDLGKIELKNENGIEKNNDETTSKDKVSNNDLSADKTSERKQQSPSNDVTSPEPIPTTATSTSSNQKNKSLTNPKDNSQPSGDNFNQNLPDDYYYPDEEEYGDDEVYLANGENICEFNGEQFIIPNE